MIKAKERALRTNLIKVLNDYLNDNGWTILFTLQLFSIHTFDLNKGILCRMYKDFLSPIDEKIDLIFLVLTSLSDN